MSKKKEEKQKKVPFNVFRKGAAALALAGVMLASPFMLTGCSDDTTDPEETTQETQDQTKSVVDVDVVYEYDNRGELWAIYTYTYSDGTTSEERVVVPKRITHIQNICLENGQTFDKFVKLDNAESVPKLYVLVTFDDESTGKVALTNDMFVVNSDQELSIPDFTKKGEYKYQISYKGKTSSVFTNFQIVDLADYAGNTITRVGLTDQSILAGTALKDIVVNITYDNSTNIYAPLSLVAGKYEDLDSNQMLDTIDTSVAGTYNVKPKDAFKFKEDSSDPDSDYAEDIDTLYIYTRDCTINHIEVRDLTFSIGDTDFETKLKAKAFTAHLFEENDQGQTSVSGTVEDLDYDLSHVNINRVGQYTVPFTYQIEGQKGVYKSELYVSVEADLSSSTPVETYAIDETTGGMFMYSPFDTIELHEVQVGESTLKVALIYSNSMGKETYSMQADYELIDSGTTLKLFDTMMNTYSFFDVDDSANEISAYTKATGTPTNYTGEIEMMDEMYDITLSVYGTTGTCVALVTVTIDMGSGPQAMPYAYVECAWVDSDTISFAGRTFNVTTGNVLVEVTE